MKTFAQKVLLLFFNELIRAYVKKEFERADVDMKKVGPYNYAK